VLKYILDQLEMDFGRFDNDEKTAYDLAVLDGDLTSVQPFFEHKLIASCHEYYYDSFNLKDTFNANQP
jgi:hypothetical protein